MWAGEPIPSERLRRYTAAMSEPAQRGASRARRESLSETVRGTVFFIAVSILSCLFGALMLGMLALLMT